MSKGADARFMRAAIALSLRGLGRTAPNPNVGCLIVRDDVVVGRGWTHPGGRPHAEALALAQAEGLTNGATAYVTLEPCFHLSPRGPRCVELLQRAGVKRVVIATLDPDPRTNGQSASWLREQGIEVETGVMEVAARQAMGGFFMRQMHGRPFITLKLGLSLDGCIAMADGSSQWITGPSARAHPDSTCACPAWKNAAHADSFLVMAMHRRGGRSSTTPRKSRILRTYPA